MTEQMSNQGRAMLYRKISAVTAAVSRIPKNGKNTFHNYKYATESDITDGLRDLLAEHGLAFLPPSVVAWERSETTKKNGDRGDDLTRVQLQFALACTETGEVYQSFFWGEGQDGGDKGFYKAYTGAVKYFLMKTFLIATGDDPEQDHGATYEHQQQRPAQSRPTQRQQPHVETNTVEAERRFFARYSSVVGGDTWERVAGYIRTPRAPKPTTVEGWIAAAEAVRDKQRQPTEQPGAVSDTATIP